MKMRIFTMISKLNLNEKENNGVDLCQQFSVIFLTAGILKIDLDHMWFLHSAFYDVNHVACY